MSTHHLRGEQTYVYRIYNSSNELIYIGCTHHVPKRLNVHRQLMWWAPQIETVKADTYADRVSAHAAEKAAIYAENPKWNIRHRSLGQTVWTEQQLRDYIQAVEHTGIRVKTAVYLRCLAKANRLLAELLNDQQAKAA